MEAKNQTPGLLAVNPLQLNHICAADASRCVAVVIENDSPQEVIDTTARMVKCWNTHDDLVAALRRIGGIAESPEGSASAMDRGLTEIGEIVSAALAKVSA